MSILGGISTDIALWIFDAAIIIFTLVLIIGVWNFVRKDDSDFIGWVWLYRENDTSTNRTSGKPRMPEPASLPSSDSPAPEEEQDPQTISYPKAWVSTSEAKEASSHVEKS